MAFQFNTSDESFDQNIRELYRMVTTHGGPKPAYINVLLDGKAVETKGIRIHPSGLLEFNGWRHERDRVAWVKVAF